MPPLRNETLEDLISLMAGRGFRLSSAAVSPIESFAFRSDEDPRVFVVELQDQPSSPVALYKINAYVMDGERGGLGVLGLSVSDVEEGQLNMKLREMSEHE